MLYFTQQTELLKPLLTVLTVCVTKNGTVTSYCYNGIPYLLLPSLTHSLAHSCIHSLTEKSQDRLQMFGGLNALSNLLEDLVKQADNVDRLFEDKMEDLLSFIPHVLQTISAATFGNGEWNKA